MDFLKNLKDNSILLIPNNIRNKILDYINDNNLLLNIKLMTFNELLEGLMYTYTNEAIYEVMKEYKVSYETAEDFIDNTYYLTEEHYTNDKLKQILSIKNMLDEKGLLVKDPLFKDLLKSKSTLYIYGFTTINKLNNHLLDLAKEYIDIEVINQEFNDYKHEAYQFQNMEDEVTYVAEKISELLDNNVPIEKIYIANYSSEYYFSIKKIFNIYGIPIYLKGETKLSDTTIGKYFIEHLSNDIEKLLSTIKKKYDVDNNQFNSKVYNKIVNLINSYYWAPSYEEVKDVIEAEMKTTSIPSDHYENEILTTNITDNIFNDDEYVFLLGFNQKSIPKSYKDEDFLDDSIKSPLMETTLEKNIASKLRYSTAIKNIKNLTISLKELSISSTYLPSTLIDGDYIKLVKKDITYSNYSDKFNKILYASRLDDLIKFNEYKEDIDILHKTYDIDYKTYDNSFTGIDSNKIKDKLSTKGYSYSSISTYFECPFRFYLDYYYRLSEFETTFNTFIGSAFHKVMEDCITDKNKDINETYYKYIEDNKSKLPFNEKEQFYVEKVKDELIFIVNTIREQYSKFSTEPTDEWHEKYLEYSTDDLGLNTNIKSIIKGVVDKCIFINDDVLIIDYKTGTSAKINRDYFRYGVTIQLPIYLYLLKNYNSKYNIVGMYLQHILRGLIYRNDGNKNKDVDKIRLDNLKLDGLTLDDEEKISEFDTESDLISGVLKNKEGEWRYPSRIMNLKDQDDIYDIIKELIETCINNTSSGSFDIRPIRDKNVNGCDYCSYRDICYRREQDINYINKEDEQEEGDTNE